MKWEDESIGLWLTKFEENNYPVSVYQELIIEGKESANKFSVMGAWKNGSLRKAVHGSAYIDQYGHQYEFTKRWKQDAPVGYDIWQYITNNQEFIRAQVSDRFTNEEPKIVKELRDKSGFGFIWTLFVLHCYYPEVYPLYDQHVYRAYCSIITNEKKAPNIASGKWSEYSKYRDFFIEKLHKTGSNYWELDRALWAFGKSIKSNVRPKAANSMDKLNVIAKLDSSQELGNQSTDWCYDSTLGAKRKKFGWKLDPTLSLSIQREFTGKNFKKIPFEQLTTIQDYIQENGWTDLANSVSKLRDKTEKEGLGKFLYEELGWSNTDAQLSSQLCALFVHAGIWASNGKEKGIKVKNLSNNWYTELETYYKNVMSRSK